jgi:hypothetical protein
VTALLIELRRSPLRWWAPGIVALTLLLSFGFEASWQDVWSQASARAQYPVLFVAPVLAAAAAWSASRTRRRGFDAHLHTMYRPRWQAEMAHLCATLIYAAGCYLVGAVTVLVVAASAGPPGLPWPSYLVLGLIATTAVVTVGHLLGLLTPPLISPVLAAVFGYLAIVYTYPYPQWAFWVVSGRPQAEILLPPLAARFVVAVALVLVVLTAAAWSARDLRNRRSRPAALLAVVALVGSLALVDTAGPLRGHREPPTPVCSEGTPRVCVWPDHALRLERLATLAERLPAASLGLLDVPDTFYEEGLRGPAPGITMAAGRPPYELTLQNERSALAMMIHQMIPHSPECPGNPAPDLREVSRARDRLFAWVYSRTVDSTEAFADDQPLQEELDRVLVTPEPEQVAWVESQLAIVDAGGCAA